MSGTITSLGVGSMLDANTIISKLMGIERIPLGKLQKTAASMQTTLSTYGQLKSQVSSLQDSLGPLLQASSYKLISAENSDPTAVSSKVSGDAVPGTYTVAVTAMASAQTNVSAKGQFNKASDPVAAGKITIDIGTWSTDPDKPGFTAAPESTPATIVIDAKSNPTLASLRDSINAAKIGVSASIVTDASGARLALTSTATGAQNGFRIRTEAPDESGSDTPGTTDLSWLNYDPTQSSSGLTLAQPGSDTQATVNGIPVSSPDNVLTGVLEGQTITVTKPTSSATIKVSRNTDSLRAMVSSFISAYNGLNKFMSGLSGYDRDSKTAGPLLSDPTALSIQRQLHQQATDSSMASTTLTNLRSVGIELQRDGSLKFNEGSFSKAIKDLPELQKAMTHADSNNPANNGFIQRLQNWTKQVLDSKGTLASGTQSLQSKITKNQNDQQKINRQLTKVQQELTRQYSALDSKVSKSFALQKYVNQQITTWQSTNSNSK